jgi:nucleotide-binding universal stress UspA family protein
MAAPVILVPLDGSPTAETVLPVARALASTLHGVLRLVRVVDTVHVGSGAHITGGPDAISRQAAADAYLRQHATTDQEPAGSAEVQTAAGDPIERIVSLAEEPDVALIAMSTQGQSGLKRWYLGGVADAVLRSTTKPIVLITPAEGALPQARLAHLVVPLDGSQLAEAALPVAELLAGAEGRITLLQVEPATPVTAGSDPGAREQVTPYLDAARGLLKQPASVSTVLLHGTPSTCITEYLSRTQVDLLVLTTHGFGGRQHLVLGSTAYRLLHCGTPVLLVRSAADAARLGGHGGGAA